LLYLQVTSSANSHKVAGIKHQFLTIGMYSARTFNAMSAPLGLKLSLT